MCKPEFISKPKVVPISRSSSSLLSVDAFETQPSAKSMAWHAVPTLVFLFAIEHALRFLFNEYKNLHPLLENETNRLILARHIGTDAFCCLVVGWMGFTSFMKVCPGFLHAAQGKPGAMPKGGYEARVFSYHPIAFRLCLFFAIYQVKNTFDTIVWGDGLLFVGHHLMCMMVSYGALFHGVAHQYAPFFMGISEMSTAVLCLLANFDDEHGVPGLADAFPTTKAVLGGTFAVAFITFRVFLWSFFGYYFISDAMLAINKTDKTRDAARPWVKVLLGSYTGLSALQVIWLGEIFRIGYEEYEKMSASA